MSEMVECVLSKKVYEVVSSFVFFLHGIKDGILIFNLVKNHVKNSEDSTVSS